MKVGIRTVKPTDQPFIFASWLNNFKPSSFGKRITNNVYFHKHHLVIERILERPTTTTLIAHSPDDPNQIFGYLVYEMVNDMPTIHYAFVKATFQRLGICKAMMEHAGINQDRYVFTHLTQAMDSILQRHTTLVYDPYWYLNL